jgi:hypothetical protein
MKREEYKVIVEIIDTPEGEVFTGYINDMKIVVQSDSLPKVFIELGLSIHVKKEIKRLKDTDPCKKQDYKQDYVPGNRHIGDSLSFS